ncbi:hypothetical protein ONZ51_g8085 [Trametes cubensis]|uniref:Zn(2)-C6 fungal-type domain-containing protein n=1 Tax=Trametes cubensis TaxID=1111947 RepID=A0AAD7X8K0_9APHY|nr:hypothetical protein ONZ51_g8085 [Trametes cubensis]
MATYYRQPPELLEYLYDPMDHRRTDQATQTPGSQQQHSPDDVLRWLDSLSGHPPSGPEGTYYDFASGQWLPGVAPYYAQPSAQQFQQGSSSTATGYAQVPMGYPPNAMFSPPAMPQEAYGTYEDYGGSDGGSYTETESAEGSNRGKHKIALHPSQPLTVEGRPRERVFVACDRCRVRKLRCDGAKPACHNCQKAAQTGAECRYDPAPKRRGQDKAPRTRSAVGHRKPRRPAVKKDQQEGTAGQTPGSHHGA